MTSPQRTKCGIGIFFLYCIDCFAASVRPRNHSSWYRFLGKPGTGLTVRAITTSSSGRFNGRFPRGFTKHSLRTTPSYVSTDWNNPAITGFLHGSSTRLSVFVLEPHGRSLEPFQSDSSPLMPSWPRASKINSICPQVVASLLRFSPATRTRQLYVWESNQQLSRCQTKHRNLLNAYEYIAD